MKRRVIQLVLLLLAGAIANVAVAWGCAINSWGFFGHRCELQIEQWPRAAPSGFPPGQRLSTDGKVGFRQIVASAEGETKYFESEWPGKAAISTPFWLQSVNQCGLPCLSLEWTMHYSTEADAPASGVWQISGLEPPSWFQDRSDLSKRLANHPLWPGFAINTIFYAAILWAVFFVPGQLRRTLRRRRGLCPACAYDLRGRGTSHQACPECGKSLIPRRTS